MEITLGHTYRWHATTETYISLACNYRSPIGFNTINVYHNLFHILLYTTTCAYNCSDVLWSVEFCTKSTNRYGTLEMFLPYSVT